MLGAPVDGHEPQQNLVLRYLDSLEDLVDGRLGSRFGNGRDHALVDSRASERRVRPQRWRLRRCRFAGGVMRPLTFAFEYPSPSFHGFTDDAPGTSPYLNVRVTLA